VTRTGDDVEVLAEHDGAAVLVRSKTVMAASFHPELADDDRVHGIFLELVASATVSASAQDAR
jgi:5'-phosphate synthase pdxT subunit